MTDAERSQLFVSANGIGAFRFPLRERWRIENDQVELAPGISLEPFEGVGLNRFMTAMRDMFVIGVQFEILAGRIERMGAEIEIGG